MFVATDGPRGQTAALSANKAGMADRAVLAEGDLVDAFEGMMQRLSGRDRVVVLGSFDIAHRARSMLLDGFRDE